MERCTPFLRRYMEVMGWSDLNWLEDVHMGYEESNSAVFDRNIDGWVTIPDNIELPDNQQGQIVRYLELRGDQVEFRGAEDSLSPNAAVFEVLRKSGDSGGVTLTLKQ